MCFTGPNAIPGVPGGGGGGVSGSSFLTSLSPDLSGGAGGGAGGSRDRTRTGGTVTARTPGPAPGPRAAGPTPSSSQIGVVGGRGVPDDTSSGALGLVTEAQPISEQEASAILFNPNRTQELAQRGQIGGVARGPFDVFRGLGQVLTEGSRQAALNLEQLQAQAEQPAGGPKVEIFSDGSRKLTFPDGRIEIVPAP